MTCLSLLNFTRSRRVKKKRWILHGTVCAGVTRRIGEKKKKDNGNKTICQPKTYFLYIWKEKESKVEALSLAFDLRSQTLY